MSTARDTITADGNEARTLEVLDQVTRRAAVRAHLDAAAVRLERSLEASPGAQMAWETLPLSLFDPGLPESIRSSWVFILRAGAVTGAERHPNSVQRTLSWRGEGDLQTREDGGGWVSHRLSSDRRAPRRKRWVSIPRNTWHQVVVRGAHWVVVSFHTALADELIEERPRPGRPETSDRRLYAGETAR